MLFMRVQQYFSLIFFPSISRYSNHFFASFFFLSLFWKSWKNHLLSLPPGGPAGLNGGGGMPGNPPGGGNWKFGGGTPPGPGGGKGKPPGAPGGGGKGRPPALPGGGMGKGGVFVEPPRPAALPPVGVDAAFTGGGKEGREKFEPGRGGAVRFTRDVRSA
jgi:hypothetical protein